jgi:hypothetical protein
MGGVGTGFHQSGTPITEPTPLHTDGRWCVVGILSTIVLRFALRRLCRGAWLDKS